MRGCWGDDVDIDNKNNNNKNNFTCALKVMTLHTIKSSTERRDHKKTLTEETNFSALSLQSLPDFTKILNALSFLH